jgi:hypothetical protein
MRNLLKNLFSLWMVWAIALPPLQAFSALPVAANSEPCAMHAAADAHQLAGHPGAAKTPCSNCKHCNERDCDSDDCGAGSCSGMHLQPAVLSSLAPDLFRAAATGEGLPPGGIASHTDPPPLPPPV